MKNIKNILKTNEYLIIIILFVVITLLILIFPNLDNSYVISSKLYINEIMVNNTYTHKDNYSDFSDYIEIYNNYNYSINLDGYHLSDSEFETKKWTFPNITIEPNEYLIIYASGKDTCDIDNKICHTNFKLSSKGETITLSDKTNNIINKFTYPALANDTAYGYVSRKYTYLNNPSPGNKNDSKMKYLKLSNKDIYINEYMSHNQRNSYDELGNYNDFIELYNNSNKDIELNNIYLSDDIDNINKYKLPNITIKKKSYLLVYLGDTSKFINNQITANFKLSDMDKYIILSNGKKIIDKVEVVTLDDNISYGKKDNKWYYFTKSTPGYENNTVSHESLGDIS
ncbi:MAG: lamin tail domain-containing protein [Bacilli bacterium]|nr:lamin tail domain-containing protein [Bacilli bacterium]